MKERERDAFTTDKYILSVKYKKCIKKILYILNVYETN